MNYPDDNIVVISTPPNPDPWKLYVGRSDQIVSQMNHLWNTPNGGLMEPKFFSNVEDYLFSRHNIVIISPWVDEVEFLVAHYAKA